MRPAAASVALLLVTACVSGTGDAGACLELQEVQRFGEFEVNREGLSAREVGAGAGVLGDVRGVVPGPDGNLYVLDRSWYKVVAFRPDGSVARIILGGAGAGPGEFQLPIHMTATGEGVSVLDYQLSRTTTFSWQGELLDITTAPLPGRFRHLMRADTLWLAPGGGGPSTGPAVYWLAKGTAASEPGPPLHVEDQPFGTSVGIAFAPDGRLISTTARPGVWMVLDQGTWLRRGTPLFPEHAPPFEEPAPGGTRVTPSRSSAVGIGMIGDSLVLQGMTVLSRDFDWNDPPERDEHANALGVFHPDGTPLTSLALPAGVDAAYLQTEPWSGRVFVRATSPYPQVVELSVAKCVEEG